MKILQLIKTSVLVIIIAFVGIFAVGCDQADTVKHNIQKDADKFKVYRRMTFINLRTDKVLYSVEGRFSLQTTEEHGDTYEIGVVIKTGEDEFKMHYFSVANNVTYVIEQVEPISTNTYYWTINWYIALPDNKVG